MKTDYETEEKIQSAQNSVQSLYQAPQPNPLPRSQVAPVMQTSLQTLGHTMVAISNRVPIILASWYSCLYVVPTPSQWIGLACVANRTLKWGLRSYVIEDVAASTLLSLGSLVLGKVEACCEDIQSALG